MSERFIVGCMIIMIGLFIVAIFATIMEALV